jgi:hypothetical protein
MITRIRIFTYIVTAIVGVAVGYSAKLAYDLAQSERLDAVGGVETYKRERVQALLALKDKIGVTDPEVRIQELESIDRQISEIENEGTEELGNEMRRVK